MFSRALSAARPATTRALRPSFNPSSLRAFSVTPCASSGGHGPPPPGLFGPGAKPGEVPGIAEQSTGLERLQYLGDAEGIDIFDTAPLDSSRIGTKKDPILVASPAPERLVGCTGSPADSHDVLWFPLMKGRQHRCLECGSVYQMDYYGEEHDDQHHH
ncbi:cytochrome c oxidase subunit VB-domain-containing protein [Lentinula aciculospora]|uniref:Cytochrome c oxidase subunit VB-domain-containing protein n=1 Tax=Lentinula aciculospora TaxID=153920 RepID=A0A9W9DMC9_9AGAR|nr:cytochrome c oxidase subunit VB-domain-containing protein [Lentinula aciculospora]